ncbi:acyl-CoA carboxylase subunit beta [Paraburkholderia ginsengisoli]|uniref:Acyl-CoA carboxylase subunit beta n=2 Tax=Paraburkholderia ginsengisoli TaxID=311231 RepID=A0A7T4TA45_9BURK|nr:acyl-CoA carboxylase subunit beta [Paraburkholderia ginsengisoli]QQC65464.1 acyl-CoA carboxylase subunit beta [Paraburkholderia ginsengisoli]
MNAQCQQSSISEERPISAQQAIDLLVDPATFVELHELAEHDSRHFGAEHRTVPGDGLVTGYGKMDGRTVLVYAHDRTFLSGSSGRMHAVKISSLLDLAVRVGAPIIGLNESSGIRIHEGVDAGTQFSDVFYKTVKASGVVPQISIIFGDCAGGASYTPALTDIIIMAGNDASMFLTGPSVIQAATGESVTKAEIGGSRVHAEVTGLAHFHADGRRHAISLARELLGYLPQNNSTRPPFKNEGDIERRTTEKLKRIIPSNFSESYNILDVIQEIVDNHQLLEIQREFAPNIVCAFAHLAGRCVGIVANQPDCKGGCLDVNSSVKAARFVRMCDSFDIPILTLIDVPGYLPGLEQETGGIIGAGAKLLHAYCEASVPKIAIVLRKAYGGAYPTLANASATDFIFALPKAEIAVMGPEGAVSVIFKRELENAKDAVQRRSELIREYREAHASSEYSARRGYINNIIPPENVRDTLISSFDLLAEKIPNDPKRRHSNIQL